MLCDELKSIWVYSRDINENCDEEFVNFAKENGYEELVAKSEVDEAIAELRKENESLKYSVATLETDLAMATRWRKCSEELPEEYTDVLFVDSDWTYYLGDMWIISTDGVNPAEQYWSGRGEPRCNNPKYWMPLPKAPEADK